MGFLLSQSTDVLTNRLQLYGVFNSAIFRARRYLYFMWHLFLPLGFSLNAHEIKFLHCKC